MTKPSGTLIVVVDDHFVQTPEGVYSVYALPYTYWQHYLEVFEEVRPLARTGSSATVDRTWVRADGAGVRFITIPDYRGFSQIMRRLPRNLLRVRRAIEQGDYVLLMGGNVSIVAWMWLQALRRPYARAVIGHDAEAVALVPDIQRFGLAKGLAKISHWLGHAQVLGARCVNYWSRQLRAEYPARRGTPNFLIPEIEIGADVMTGPRAAESFKADPLHLVSVGRLNPEKGYAVLLDALKGLDDSGERRWRLEIIGPGPELETMRRRATDFGLADRVAFAGPVPWGPELFARLDRADLFVLPSVGGEGMPRALLEAMARGVPAVVTTVSGMPDVVDEQGIVPSRNAAALAETIRKHIGARGRLAERSILAFQRAQAFGPGAIRERRHEFWLRLRECTEQWCNGTQRRNGRGPVG